MDRIEKYLRRVKQRRGTIESLSPMTMGENTLCKTLFFGDTILEP